ncbi:MAG: UDP-N-acetylmuramate dehydrogenase [Planctomycetes bacterium]|nr:UDP-N-acetylmuramate dehydrogenase [Planctomycetota bacterium]
MTATIRDVFERFGPSCLRDELLARHTTFRIGGPARCFLQPATVEELAEMLAACRAAGLVPRFLGGGANLLVRDEGVDVAVSLRRFRRFAVAGERVDAGAGLTFMALIQRTRDLGLAGLEKLVGIPGSVGGVLFMNAGGKHGEVGDAVASITVADTDGHVRVLRREEAGFAYRRSGLAGLIVLEGRFQLTPGDPAALRATSRAVHEEKERTQPLSTPSAGCTFKNPPGDKAGRLIEAAGLKGRRVGGASVSLRHANFVVNDAGASAADVLDLIEIVRAVVKDRFGVELELEVQVW